MRCPPADSSAAGFSLGALTFLRHARALPKLTKLVRVAGFREFWQGIRVRVMMTSLPRRRSYPFHAWRLRNAELLTEQGGRLGHDSAGFCAEHRQALSYREQKCGACSWCVPVNPQREPAYWASHWRLFTERA
jgi:hypothetical protein